MRYAAGPHAGEVGGSETQEYVTEQTAAGLAAVFFCSDGGILLAASSVFVQVACAISFVIE